MGIILLALEQDLFHLELEELGVSAFQLMPQESLHDLLS